MLVLGVAVGLAWADEDDPEPRARSGDLASEWELTEMKAKGMAFPLPKEFKMSFTFKRDGTLAMSGMGQEQKAGKYKAFPGKNPKEIDMTVDGMTQKLLYEVEKDTLSLAGAEGQGGGPRPKDFASAEMMLVFKRVTDKPKKK